MPARLDEQWPNSIPSWSASKKPRRQPMKGSCASSASMTCGSCRQRTPFGSQRLPPSTLVARGKNADPEVTCAGRWSWSGQTGDIGTWVNGSGRQRRRDFAWHVFQGRRTRRLASRRPDRGRRRLLRCRHFASHRPVLRPDDLIPGAGVQAGCALSSNGPLAPVGGYRLADHLRVGWPGITEHENPLLRYGARAALHAASRASQAGRRRRAAP